MKIAICDNDKLQLESINKYILEYFDNTAEVYMFESDADMIEHIKAGLIINILIMDIELNDNRNGIDCVKVVNSLIPHCKVIFLTGFIEYVSDVYETAHEYYVLKTNSDVDLPRALKKATTSLLTEKTTILVDNKNNVALVDTESIKYVERYKRISRIVCDTGVYCSAQKLDELIETLDDNRFVRCHNSFIVNFQNVVSYKNSNFIFKNGEVISVSRSFKKSVDKAFLSYIKAAANI